MKKFIKAIGYPALFGAFLTLAYFMINRQVDALKAENEVLVKAINAKSATNEYLREMQYDGALTQIKALKEIHQIEIDQRIKLLENRIKEKDGSLSAATAEIERLKNKRVKSASYLGASIPG
ncbi:hypothetical protein ACFLU6_04235 [Acidobacteriota bacterium]